MQGSGVVLEEGGADPGVPVVVVAPVAEFFDETGGLFAHVPGQLGGGPVAGEPGYGVAEFHDIFGNFVGGLVGGGAGLQGLEFFEPVKASFGFFVPVVKGVGGAHRVSSYMDVQGTALSFSRQCIQVCDI